METLNFFFVKKKFIIFFALKDYLCEDLIIKIIENNIGDKKWICNSNPKIHMVFKILKNFLMFYIKTNHE